VARRILRTALKRLPPLSLLLRARVCAVYRAQRIAVRLLGIFISIMSSGTLHRQHAVANASTSPALMVAAFSERETGGSGGWMLGGGIRIDAWLTYLAVAQ